MWIEQEIASIMSFALAAAGNPSPFYYDVPESFTTPAIYFPQPEITTSGETFGTYRLDYAWYINLIDRTTEDAQAMAMRVLTAIKQARNLVPLINEDGRALAEKLRLNDPYLQKVDTGVVQIRLEWRRRRPYSAEAAQKMMEWHIQDWEHPDIYAEHTATIGTAPDTSQTANDYPRPEYASE